MPSGTTCLRFAEVTTRERLRQVGVLRAAVWGAEECFNPAVLRDGMWLDEWDGTARQWAFLDGDAMVAAARLSIHEDLSTLPCGAEFRPYLGAMLAPCGYVSRLVVHPDYRGRGLAAFLDIHRLRAAREAGCRSVAALPVPWRTGQLRRQGYVTLGPSPVPAETMHDLRISGDIMVHYLREIPELPQPR